MEIHKEGGFWECARASGGLEKTKKDGKSMPSAGGGDLQAAVQETAACRSPPPAPPGLSQAISLQSCQLRCYSVAAVWSFSGGTLGRPHQ